MGGTALGTGVSRTGGDSLGKDRLWPMTATGTIWIAVLIKRNAFRQAESGLIRQGFSFFAPKLRRQVRRFGKLRSESALLFPGYVFVAVDLARANWRAIGNTPGVSRFVTRKAGEPAEVPAELIDGLMSRCGDDGHILPPSELLPGDQVRLAEGPMSAFVATVERVDENRRVWILLDLLGARREVRVDMDDLQPERIRKG